MEPMRDLFEHLSSAPPDPIASARRSVRPARRKRFYRTAGAGESSPYAILLDGKPVRTPARRTLAAPSRKLAEAIAAEWEAQREFVDPAAMPLTRLANSVIDGVVDAPGPVADEIGKYLGSDLVCYRAGEPAGLVARQAQHWDPVLDWARDALGAKFVLGKGVIHTAQPDSALAAARTALPGDPWRLGGLHVVTTLTGSALLALALEHGRLSLDEAWQAAHVDEDWNMELWGRDELALDRRALRFAEMQAAASVLSLR
jgi:chaperone required for assembly of F1-ATPase